MKIYLKKNVSSSFLICLMLPFPLPIVRGGGVKVVDLYVRCDPWNGEGVGGGRTLLPTKSSMGWPSQLLSPGLVSLLQHTRHFFYASKQPWLNDRADSNVRADEYNRKHPGRCFFPLSLSLKERGGGEDTRLCILRWLH